MLCSECNKNTAVLFINKVENGQTSLEGLCYDCAKKKGINPLEVLSKQNDILSKDKINMSDMTKQLETIFKDLSENMNFEDLEGLGLEELEMFSNENEDGKITGAAIPIGSIFANMFGGYNEQNQ